MSIKARIDRMRTSDGRIAPRWRWAGGLVVLALIVAIATGVFWSLVVVAGFAAIVVGLYAALRGSSRRFRVPSRRSAIAVLAAGLIVTVIGTSASASNHVTPVSGAASMSVATTAPAEGKRSAAPAPSPDAVETEKEVSEDSVVPFDAVTVDDANSDVGTSSVSVAGQEGRRTTTYRVTYRDGVEISRVMVGDEVVVPPVTQVTAVGTREPAPPAPAPAPAPVDAAPVDAAPIEAAPAVPAPPAEDPAPVDDGGCDPNYADACVPIASDVDCAGGSGNGPAYVTGPVRIVGDDIYDLDRDGDGIACD